MVGIEIELQFLFLYLFCIIGKKFAGNDAFALNENVRVDLLFDGKFEVGGEQSEDVAFGGELNTVQNRIAALDGKRFCDFCKSI